MVYEPDNTEVLMGVEGDTLDVFFVRGYYRELGYIEAGNCWWKDPGVPLSSGLRSLVTDADLVAMCKNYRRNHNLINIYLEHCISQPCIVDQIEDEVVNMEAEGLKQGECSSQPVKKPTTIDPQSQKQTSHPNRTTSQPKSQPNPTMKPISEPNKPKVKPMSQPNKVAHQPKKTTSQPKKTTAQPMKPVSQAKKTIPPQSNSSSEAGNNSQGAKDKQNSSGCRVTRYGRQVKEAPLQKDDTDSHDSYESTEDELYRPPKVVGDNLYSSESDSDSGKEKRSGKGESRSEVREKQKPPKKRLADKEIDTDDSNYEGSEDEESSESDLDDSDAASDADSWHLEDSDKVLESDEESPAVYPQFNDKTKFGELKFEVRMPCMHAISAIHDKNDKRAEDYCHDWLKMEAYRKTYCFNVNPVKGQDLWEKTPHSAPVPPPFKAKPGRPTKKRRRDKEEQHTGSKTKMKRKYNPIRCMYCSEIGHNKQSCAKKKATEAEEHARQLQLQLALVAPAAEGAAPEATTVPAEPNPAPSPTQTPTVIDISQCDSIPPTQETQQEQLNARPSKLKVIKGKARLQSSPKPTVAAPVAISAETIKGTSSATAKKLADFMTFVMYPHVKAYDFDVLPSCPVSMPPSTSIHHSHYQPAAQPRNLSSFHFGPSLHTHHPQPT
ncbi:hypothetical protein Ahy_B08g089582 [Arachis hypogaea]|uniref:PB1-like domain-containing protein n=1 Tax=Arachis hypogaea TaxID=3818 RepID=A0A444XYB2_ARAHY|nr:hypothetical protein Ahy_B08g089582 [Arachis hypogaea]